MEMVIRKRERLAEIRVLLVRYHCSHGAAAEGYDWNGLLGVIHAK